MALTLANQIQRTLPKGKAIHTPHSACSLYTYREAFMSPDRESCLCKNRNGPSVLPMVQKSKPKPLKPALSAPQMSIGHFQLFSTTQAEEEEEELEMEVDEEDIEAAEHEEDMNVPVINRAYFKNFRDMSVGRNEAPVMERTDELNAEARNKYRKAMEERLRDDKTYKYRLETARPREEEEDGRFDVFEYYTERHKLKESTVLPHLQPNNLRPFGANDSIVFPSMQKPRPPSYQLYGVFGPSTDDVPAVDKKDDQGKTSTPQQRDYSTSKFMDALRAVMPKAEPVQQSVGQQRKQHAKATVNKESSTRMQGQENRKTSQYAVKPSHLKVSKSAESITRNLSPSRRRSSSTVAKSREKEATKPGTAGSQEVSKLNNLISDFKKLNPETHIRKKDLPPGSAEEKAAVDNAIKFAQDYRQKLFNPKTKSEDSNKPFLHTNHFDTNMSQHDVKRFRTVVRSDPSLEVPPQTEVISKDVTERPDENEPPSDAPAVRVKTVPKMNVPQTSAFPEDGQLVDRVNLGNNEKLTAPWPAYSETVRLKMKKPSTLLIKYPQLPDQKKPPPPSEVYVRRYSTVSGNEGLGMKELICNTVMSFVRTLHNCAFKRDYGTASSRHPLGPEGTVMPKLCRLKKRKVKQPARVCPKPEPCFGPSRPRLDDCLEVKPKQLPCFKPMDCPPKKPKRLRKGCPLRRPPKRCVKHKKCKRKKVRKCMPRADDGLCVQPKELPGIPCSDCPKIKPKLRDCSPLRRPKRRKLIKQKRVCKPKPKPCKLPKKPVVKRKCLPVLIPPDCPEIEPIEPKPVPLCRPKKRCVPEPVRVCPPPPKCPPRADRHYKVKRKKLQTLILCEEHNEMSIREFNGDRRYHTDARKIRYCTSYKCRRNYSTGRNYVIDANSLLDGTPFDKPAHPNSTPLTELQLTGPGFNNNAVMRRPPSGVVLFSSRASNPCESAKCPCGKNKPQKSLWQKIVDYFKARPNCPAPGEWKKKRLREDAEKAAAKAGLILCDPKCATCKPQKKRKAKKCRIPPVKKCRIPPVKKCKEPKPLPSVITAKDVCKKKKKKKCATTCIKKPPRCKVFNLCECPPRMRYTCRRKIEGLKCCEPQLAPYKSFSETCGAIPEPRINECTVAEQRVLETQRKEWSRRRYSTWTTQFREYSNSTKNPKDPLSIKDSLENIDQKELARRILTAVKKGMEILGKQEQEGNAEQYRRICKLLDRLSTLNQDDKDHVPASPACKAQYREAKRFSELVEEFADGKQPRDIAGYEETERKKTEEMVRRIDRLLNPEK